MASPTWWSGAQTFPQKKWFSTPSPRSFRTGATQYWHLGIAGSLRVAMVPPWRLRCLYICDGQTLDAPCVFVRPPYVRLTGPYIRIFIYIIFILKWFIISVRKYCGFCGKKIGFRSRFGLKIGFFRLNMNLILRKSWKIFNEFPSFFLNIIYTN